MQHDQVATFLLKKSPFTPEEIARLHDVASRLEFRVLYAPPLNGVKNVAPSDEDVAGTQTADYARLVETTDRQAFYANYGEDIRPTTDDRPFFFHTTKLKDQFQVAFGRKMLFGNGLSALMTLMGISVALVVLFVVGPLVMAGGDRPRGWPAWLVYFGALGAGFMLIEVSLLQRFVLLLGHPVYSLTVTLFSLLLGTGLGAAWSRRFDAATLKRTSIVSLAAVALVGVLALALGDAAHRMGDSVLARDAYCARRRRACAGRHGARAADAGGHPAASRPRAADGDVGVGHQRRALGARRNGRDLHRDELGFRRHPPHGLRDVSRRPRRSARHLKFGVGSLFLCAWRKEKGSRPRISPKAPDP